MVASSICERCNFEEESSMVGYARKGNSVKGTSDLYIKKIHIFTETLGRLEEYL